MMAEHPGRSHSSAQVSRPRPPSRAQLRKSSQDAAGRGGPGDVQVRPLLPLILRGQLELDPAPGPERAGQGVGREGGHLGHWPCPEGPLRAAAVRRPKHRLTLHGDGGRVVDDEQGGPWPQDELAALLHPAAVAPRPAGRGQGCVQAPREAAGGAGRADGLLGVIKAEGPRLGLGLEAQNRKADKDRPEPPPRPHPLHHLPSCLPALPAEPMETGPSRAPSIRSLCLAHGPPPPVVGAQTA